MLSDATKDNFVSNIYKNKIQIILTELMKINVLLIISFEDKKI
jgi:hypothetical protein